MNIVHEETQITERKVTFEISIIGLKFSFSIRFSSQTYFE